MASEKNSVIYLLRNHTPRLRAASRNKARRRLFQEPDPLVQAQLDNYNNAVIEEHALEIEARKKKWNYDFENDVPIPNERWQWYSGDDGKVYGVDTLATATTVETKDSEDGQEMKLQNETTPKSNKNEDEQEHDAALGSKRMSDDNEVVANDTVRRRISFE